MLQCIIWLFQNFLGTQVNFSDPISIRMPWENCFAVPNQQLLLVYGGSGAQRNALQRIFDTRVLTNKTIYQKLQERLILQSIKLCLNCISGT